MIKETIQEVLNEQRQVTSSTVPKNEERNRLNQVLNSVIAKIPKKNKGNFQKVRQKIRSKGKGGLLTAEDLNN